MLLVELILALLFAALVFWALIGILDWGSVRTRADRGGLIFLFFLLLLGIWAGGVWITPFGPTLFGVYWFPFLMMGIFFLLLLATARPVRRPGGTQRTPPEKASTEIAADESTAAAFGVFFWILMGILLASLATHYAVMV